ncbi:MAG: squalene/phytoene synthase family protein [Chloroflexi bacterium]|nr:squalene/phytoene synthase family protein [Chloroflexota bacterium]
MSVGASWEHTLVCWARQGLETQATSHTPTSSLDRGLLRRAYSHCEAVTREHSRTFFLASGLLPPAKRRAVRALYAFCRVSDDLVDCADGDRHAALADWRARVMAPLPQADDPVVLAWADARACYGIPDGYVEQLLSGVGADLECPRYRSFDDLAAYCYGVASTVGLMAMHIIGFAGAAAIPYAVKLGVALQITNILRDVGEDWAAGRLYLPQEELEAHGLSEDDVAEGRVDARWMAFLRFQIARARRLYAEALPGVGLLHRDGRFAIAAAAELYENILGDIEASGGDVFRRRAHVTRNEKLRRLPGIWWRAVVRGYRLPAGAPDQPGAG